MSLVWKTWIIYLLIFDLAAAAGLWQGKSWGIQLFFVVAISQLVAYIEFPNIFGDQLPLILFHIATIAIFFSILGISKIRRSLN